MRHVQKKSPENIWIGIAVTDRFGNLILVKGLKGGIGFPGGRLEKRDRSHLSRACIELQQEARLKVKDRLKVELVFDGKLVGVQHRCILYWTTKENTREYYPKHFDTIVDSRFNSQEHIQDYLIANNKIKFKDEALLKIFFYYKKQKNKEVVLTHA